MIRVRLLAVRESLFSGAGGEGVRSEVYWVHELVWNTFRTEMFPQRAHAGSREDGRVTPWNSRIRWNGRVTRPRCLRSSSTRLSFEASPILETGVLHSRCRSRASRHPPLFSPYAASLAMTSRIVTTRGGRAISVHGQIPRLSPSAFASSAIRGVGTMHSIRVYFLGSSRGSERPCTSSARPASRPAGSSPSPRP